MKTHTGQQIADFIAKNDRVTAKTIIEHINLTPPAVFRQLLKLIEQGVIIKQGKPPKVFYSTAPPSIKEATYRIASPTFEVIEHNFLKVSPDGILQKGTKAFANWCLARGLDPTKSALDYVTIVDKYNAYKHDGLIDGLPKIKHTFNQVYLDELYYLDFYSIERFGKTRLGELTLYAKQSQNKKLTRLIVDVIRPRIMQLIQDKQIEAVGFVPPTVKRQVQFMKELEGMLNLSTFAIKITKIKTPIIVPQKTLTKLEERVQNAHNSIVVEEETPHKNILLIDDAVGSGATINEVAKQLKEKGVCLGKIYGLAITGSFSGFEVLQEV